MTGYSFSARLNTLPRGLLIVFEGLDRCGKSTQCQMLQQALQQMGYSVDCMRFPSRESTIGKFLGDYLCGNVHVVDDLEAVHLIFAANRWEMRRELESKLSKGVIVIIDRYIASGLAFSMAKGLALDWCVPADAGLPAADMTFYLQISPEQAALRGNYGRERYEVVEFQQKVALAYQRQISCHHPPWISIDANQPMADLHDQILNNVKLFIESFHSSSIRLFPALINPTSVPGFQA